MIIAQLSIAPVGKSVSLSRYVKIAIETLKKENIKFETNAMATVFEIEDLDTLFNIVQKAHTSVLASGVERVITELKIDDRRDKNATIKTKLKSVQ
ncbi:MAG: MTH1187 family thiamine-binding protein [Thermoplasmatales archaeon]|nr:MAG: MTH1187 family thiamine-binding protein [Thermoplasmatales archaeon]